MTSEHRSAWKCMQCRSSEPRSDNTNTPVRGGFDNITMHRGTLRNRMSPDKNIKGTCEMDVSFADNRNSLNNTALDSTLGLTEAQTLVAEIRLMRGEMQAMRLEIQNLSAAVFGLTTRIDGCDKRIDGLSFRIDSLEHRLETSTDRNQPAELLDTITQLKSELNNRDQDQLQNDIEISCVHEQKGESVIHTVMTLAQKLGVDLEQQDIVSATRVGRTTGLEDTNIEASRPPRPRLIVVRLVRRSKRDELLRSARVRRGVTTEGTQLPGPPGRYYINERLTRINRDLFRKAREYKERHNWRFAWTRDGRIYVRKNPGKNEPRHRIYHEADLVRVFH